MNIRKITIAGAGTMGYSMAEIFARDGYDVILWNHRRPTLEKARSLIDPSVVPKIAFVTDMAAFKNRDLIIETIVENLGIKQTFLASISSLARDDTLIASNTSGLSINRLSAAVKKPERFIGMHWFNPPTLIPLIEIIKSSKTSDVTAKAIYDLALTIHKKPAVLEKDVPGFAGNRLQLAVIREACHMVEEGVISPEGIDAVMKYGIGFRWACLGPMETMDFGGIDIFTHISEYLMQDLANGKGVPKLLEEKFEKGDLGVKTGKGFYDYSGDKAKKATEERDKKLKAIYEALYK